jgi:ethanolamine utilization protein EutQ (cupin superfamily)
LAATLIRHSSLNFKHRGGPPGHAEVARAVSIEMSNTMGAGVAHFDACSVAWTVLYDEVVYVIEGVFRLVVNEGVLEAAPGDILWIPEGTELRYEGDRASIFYAVYPGNWKATECT